MRILICDDNPLIQETLSDYLTEFFQKKHSIDLEMAFFPTGEALLGDTDQQDIVFLDIEMPGVNGVFVGNELKKRNRNLIIFVVTSYLEYLDEAMRFQVFRYLSKPIEKHRLFRNMEDALRLYYSANTYFLLETKQKNIRVALDDIVCVEAIGRQICVHTTSADQQSVHSFKYWQEQLLVYPNFYQTHRSYLINMKYVSSFDKTTVQLNCIHLNAYLTRRNYIPFKQTYLRYLESIR